MDDYLHDILVAQEKDTEDTGRLFQCFLTHVELRAREVRDILSAFCKSEYDEIRKINKKRGVKLQDNYTKEELDDYGLAHLKRDEFEEELEGRETMEIELTPPGALPSPEASIRLRETLSYLISDQWEQPVNVLDVQFYLESAVCFYNGLSTRVGEEEVERVFPLMLQVDRRMGVIRRLAIAQIATSHDAIGKINTKIGSGQGQTNRKENNHAEIERAFRELEEDDLPLKLTLSNVARKILEKYPSKKGESKPTEKAVIAWLKEKKKIIKANIEDFRNIVGNNLEISNIS